MTKSDFAFERFLQVAEVTDDFAGDFLTDLRDDRRRPQFRTRTALNRYLTEKHACPEAFQGAHMIWKRFRSSQHEEARP